jgi:DNA-binding response OmpR family regulator
MRDSFEPRELCEVVVVSEFDVGAKSLGSMLESNGYAVRHAASFQESRDIVCNGGTDAVIVMGRSPEMSAVDFCRRLHGDPHFDATTPVLVVTSGDCTRTERFEVLSAGAWETSPEPLDGELLLLKLQPFMRMRRAVGKLARRSLIDAATGLYSLEGLIRRSSEVAALAVRRKQPLAMIAIETAPTGDARSASLELSTLISNTGVWCRNSIRATDALGRVADNTFCCIAPDADAAGARALLSRLQGGLERHFSERVGRDGATVKAGFCATTSFGSSEMGAVEMLFRSIELAAHSHPGQAVGESV